MKKLSEKMLDLQTSSVRSLAKYTNGAIKKGKRIYELNIGQPDLNVPEEYYNYIRTFNEATIEYMPSNGTDALREAVQKYYEEIGIDYDKSQIYVTTGGTEAVLFAMIALSNPNDEFIVFEPYYSNYNTLFTMSGVTPVAVTTGAENGFHINREALEAKVTDKTKAILVTNPSNPTGTVLSKEEVQMIADVALKNDLYIISDEVYREIVFDEREILSFGFLENIHDRLIIIDSVSKRFCACGARIGFILSKNKEVLEIISKLCQGRLAVSTIEQHGAVGLFSSGKRVINEVRDEFQRRRDLVYNKLQSIPGIVCSKPEGAFYTICKLPVEDSEKFLIWMLEEFDDSGETIMAAPGDGFYLTEGLGMNEIRIAYVLEPEKLERAMELLKMGLDEFIKKYPAHEKSVLKEEC